MLYTLSKADYDKAHLTTILDNVSAEDAVLLWQDGVLQAVKNPECFANLTVFVLAQDIEARGLNACNPFPTLTLAEFISLTETQFPQVAL